MNIQAVDLVSETIAQRLAEEIRAEMARRKLSAIDLAAALGVTPHTAGRRLNGSVPFNVIEIAKVASWLGLDLSELISRAAYRAVSTSANELKPVA